jgi:ABC-type nickel/cobalt efflux system permease component RcnA
MSGGRATRRLGAVAMAGAGLQLVYGVLAVVWPYPQITATALELVWGLINVGMVAGIAAWLAIDVARPRWLALIGGCDRRASHPIRRLDLDHHPTERQPRQRQHHDCGFHRHDVRRVGGCHGWAAGRLDWFSRQA